MDISEIENIILSWDSLTSERMKKYIHYYSMRNFVIHFNEIKAEKARENVAYILSEYINEVQQNNFEYDREESYQLARKYLPKISDYYREYSNFVGFINLPIILLYGILGDLILYFTGVSARIKHFPIVTVCFIFYYLFVIIIKKPKGRVYGIYY